MIGGNIRVFSLWIAAIAFQLCRATLSKPFNLLFKLSYLVCCINSNVTMKLNLFQHHREDKASTFIEINIHSELKL